MEFTWNTTVEQDASPAAGIQCAEYGRTVPPDLFNMSTLVLRMEQVIDGNVMTSDVSTPARSMCRGTRMRSEIFLEPCETQCSRHFRLQWISTGSCYESATAFSTTSSQRSKVGVEYSFFAVRGPRTRTIFRETGETLIPSTFLSQLSSAGVANGVISSSQLVYKIANPDSRSQSCGILQPADIEKLPWTFVDVTVKKAKDFFAVSDKFTIKTKVRIFPVWSTDE